MEQEKQFNAAVAQLRSGNAASAARLCDESLQQHPGDANFLCLSAKANLVLRNFAVAEKCVEDAIKLFPDFALAYETYGDLMLAQGKAAKARTSYETAMRLDPAHAAIHDKIDRAREIEKTATTGAARPAASAQAHFQAEMQKARELESK